MGNVTIVTDKNFDEQVLADEGYVLVSFAATWSPPSQAAAQILRKIASERSDIRFAKIDVGGADPSLAANDNPVTRERLNIKIFPTLLLFKKGEVAGMLLGEPDEGDVTRWLEGLTSTPNPQTIPIEGFRAYIDNYYKELQDSIKLQGEKNEKRLMQARRHFSMAYAFARAAGGFMLASVLPGPLTAIMGGCIAGPGVLHIINTLKSKNGLPQEPSFRGRPLRMAFNLACLAGGAFLMSAAASVPLLSLTGAAGLGLGFCVTWHALTNLGRDIGAMLTTKIENYPVNPPENGECREEAKPPAGNQP